MDYLERLHKLIEVNDDKHLSEPHTAFNIRTDNVVLRRQEGVILIDTKGTERTIAEWVKNFRVDERQWLNMGRVERGFAFNVEYIVGGVHEPESLISICLASDDPIDIAGQSRGGPISLLIAAKLVFMGVDASRIKVTVFGTPRIGDSDFRRAYRKILGANTTTINGRFDPVTMVPFWSDHHGEVIKLNQLYLIKHSIQYYEKALQNLI